MIQTWHICHKTARGVQSGKLLLNPTITSVNNSACHPAADDLDVKLLDTTKTGDVVLEDLVPTSIPSPHTTMNRECVGELLNVSHDLNGFHIFNDNNKMNSNGNNEPEHPKIKEVKVTNQQKDTVIKSELVSRTTTKIVHLDHMKEFQACMNSYKIANGVHLFDMIA